MEIKFEATKEELAEIAKISYVAQFVIDSSGKHGTGYKYPGIDTFNAALRIMNKMLCQYIPESGLVEADERNTDIFTHTIQMENECEPLLQEFGEFEFLDALCTKLAERDYAEQYKGLSNQITDIGVDVFQILFDNNMEELSEYGLSRLRIVPE